MKKDELLFLSNQYTKEDWFQLRTTDSSSPCFWESAINIFRDRMEGRFLHQLELFQETTDSLENNTFIIASLDCLLIETLSHFYYGANPSVGKSGERYQSFLKVCFENRISDNLVRDFYCKIRCGLLHSAQTEGKSYLTYGRGAAIGYDENNYLFVSVDKLTRVIQQYYELYISVIEHGSCDCLRKNFLWRMDYLANRFCKDTSFKHYQRLQ